MKTFAIITIGLFLFLRFRYWVQGEKWDEKDFEGYVGIIGVIALFFCFGVLMNWLFPLS